MNGTKSKLSPSTFLKSIMLVAPILISMQALANDEAILKSDPINIEGYVKDQPNVTDSELEYINNELTKQKNEIHLNKEKTKKYQKLQKTTEKLAEETEAYLDEKSESQKVIDEYNKKIKCLLEKKDTKECKKYSKSKLEDSVSNQAAAVAKNEAAVETKRPLGLGELKILPYTGLTMINANAGQLEANLTAGVAAEANIASKFSVGMGFNYTTLENTDFCVASADCFGVWSGYYTPFNNQIGRQQEYTRMSLDAFAKFFPLENDRFRPYLGAGLSYSRSSLKYTSNNQNAFYNNNMSYLNANEEVEMRTFSGSLMLGSEVRFTQMIGMNIEFKYAKAMSVNANNNNPFSQFVPGQRRLNTLATDIENADNISIFAGLLVTF